MSVVRLAVIAVAASLPGCGGGERVETEERMVTEERVITTEVTVTQTLTVQAKAPPVYVLGGFSGGLDYKPSEIALGATSGISRINWRKYGGQVATGFGFIGEEEVRVELQRLVPCDGVVAYSYLVYGDNDAFYELGDCP